MITVNSVSWSRYFGEDVADENKDHTISGTVFFTPLPDFNLPDGGQHDDTLLELLVAEGAIPPVKPGFTQGRLQVRIDLKDNSLNYVRFDKKQRS